MQHFSRATRGLRTWVAIAASYALVLQLLLGGIATAQIAAAAASPADMFALCLNGGDPAENGHKQNGAPAAHQACMACTIVAAASLPVVDTTATVARFASALAFRLPAVPAAALVRPHSPRSSQGPPRIA